MGILKQHAGGKYLRSDDIEGTGKEFGLVQLIKDFTEADVSRQDDPESEMKPIIHFESDATENFFDPLKPMVLNATNLNMILGLFHTDDEEKIRGQKIGVYVDDRVQYAGKTVKGLRLCDWKEISTEKKTA